MEGHLPFLLPLQDVEALEDVEDVEDVEDAEKAEGLGLGGLPQDRFVNSLPSLAGVSGEKAADMLTLRGRTLQKEEEEEVKVMVQKLARYANSLLNQAGVNMAMRAGMNTLLGSVMLRLWMSPANSLPRQAGVNMPTTAGISTLQVLIHP